MVANIEDINLWRGDDSKRYNKVPLVKINFKFPCEWTVLNLEDLKQILRMWIQGEEEVYPQPEFKGRWLLFDEIKKVFEEKGAEND